MFCEIWPPSSSKMIHVSSASTIDSDSSELQFNISNAKKRNPMLGWTTQSTNRRYPIDINDVNAGNNYAHQTIIDYATQTSRFLLNKEQCELAAKQIIKILKQLQKYGLDINKRNKNGETLLHIASDTGCFVLMTYLLSEFPELVSHKTSYASHTYKCTILHNMCFAVHRVPVEEIQAALPAILKYIQLQTTYSHSNIEPTNSLELVNAIDSFGNNCLHYLLIPHIDGSMPLHIQNIQELHDNTTYSDTVRNMMVSLIHCGVDVNLKMGLSNNWHSECAPIHLVCANFPFLLEDFMNACDNVDINAENSHNLKPIHYMIENVKASSYDVQSLFWMYFLNLIKYPSIRLPQSAIHIIKCLDKTKENLE